MKWTWACGGLLWMLAGCGTSREAFRPNPNDEDPLVGSIPIIHAPPRDRCAMLGKTAVHSSCDEAKYLATEYTRRLSVGDEICLEGNYGDEPTAACKARAAIIDTGRDQVKIEVRTARPDSRWFKAEMRHAWYDEGALVDLYLAERGY